MTNSESNMALNIAEILVAGAHSDVCGCQNRMWHQACYYAARSNFGGMACLVGVTPDQPDTFCFSDGMFVLVLSC
jgi:hypothetical protein